MGENLIEKVFVGGELEYVEDFWFELVDGVAADFDPGTGICCAVGAVQRNFGKL